MSLFQQCSWERQSLLLSGAEGSLKGNKSVFRMDSGEDIEWFYCSRRLAFIDRGMPTKSRVFRTVTSRSQLRKKRDKAAVGDAKTGVVGYIALGASCKVGAVLTCCEEPYLLASLGLHFLKDCQSCKPSLKTYKGCSLCPTVISKQTVREAPVLCPARWHSVHCVKRVHVE